MVVVVVGVGVRKSAHVSAVYVQWRTGGGGAGGGDCAVSRIQPPPPLLCASAWQNGNRAAPPAAAPPAPVSQGAAGEREGWHHFRETEPRDQR